MAKIEKAKKATVNKTPELAAAKKNLENYLKENKLDPTKDYSKDKKHGKKVTELLSKLNKERDKAAAKYPESDPKQMKKINIYSKNIVRVIDYIYDNLHKPLTVKIIAENVGISETYLSKLFKKETGTSVSSYIRSRRIEAAQNMLKFSEYSYEEIAEKLHLPMGTVKTQIHRARERMCRLITEGENK